MAGSEQIEIEVVRRISDVSARDWDALACPESSRAIDPFTTHKFLNALEKSGSVADGCGWSPRHLLVRLDGRLIAAMPLYLKYHSQGEYVFDHGWANAFEGAGGRYYPKLQAAVPFTPVAGPRFLVLQEYAEIGRTTLVQSAIKLAAENHLSSFHVTFCTEDEARFGQELGLMQRTGQQFHWHNDGYADFDEFLSRLSSRKRKAIRRERNGAARFGGMIHQFSGEEIQEQHWDAFWRFYQDTGGRKWGTPYLTRAFFDEVQANLRQETLLILCEREGRWVAGALNFIGRDTLFGRYWGCVEDHPFLHFEVCYYQAIDKG